MPQGGAGGFSLPSAARPLLNTLVLPCLQFWVSQKNKWCEYCKVWMKDTAHSWAVHERGAGHQENVARSECRRPPARPAAAPRRLCRIL